MRAWKPRLSNQLLLIVFLVGLVPACSRLENSVPGRDPDNALLLQISSHVRLSGEADLSSYAQRRPAINKSAAVRPILAPETTTELDILINLYTTYMSRLQAQGKLTDSNFARIDNQLQAKIQTLNRRSQQLESRRGRRRRGLAGFFRRVGRAIGRFVSQLGKGIGKAAEYLIEEVAPDVIRDMVLTGQPLNAKVFWKGVRKVVRSRLKKAVGSKLVSQGVPPEILANAGLDIEVELEKEDEKESQSTGPEIGYGNYYFMVNEDGKNEGFFSWLDYWTNLPDDGIDDCQPLGKSTMDADAYLDDFQPTLEFYFDSGQVKGSFSGDGSFDITYEVTDWAYEGIVHEGWVRPSADGRGWIFGGTIVFGVSIYDQLRCWHCIPAQGGCDIVEKWIEEDKAKEVRARLDGWTEQVVAGEGDQPDRLAPGGVYTVSVTYEGSDALLAFDCIDCVLPAGFPPPVYVQE